MTTEDKRNAWIAALIRVASDAEVMLAMQSKGHAPLEGGWRALADHIERLRQAEAEYFPQSKQQESA